METRGCRGDGHVSKRLQLRCFPTALGGPSTGYHAVAADILGPLPRGSRPWHWRQHGRAGEYGIGCIKRLRGDVELTGSLRHGRHVGGVGQVQLRIKANALRIKLSSRDSVASRSYIRHMKHRDTRKAYLPAVVKCRFPILHIGLP